MDFGLHNSILALRQRELAMSKKPFVARGGKVKRCANCILPEVDCMCAWVPEPISDAAFLFLLYKGECYKPSNTGRLIADVVKTQFAFTWQRTEPQPELLAILEDPQYFPMIIFPHEYAAPERCIHQIPADLEGRKPLYVILDGTWREAGKMFRKSAYLQSYPVLGIQPQSQSGYLLREAAHDHQLCTAEVGIEVLKLAGELSAAQSLADYFQLFRRQYLRGKPHLTDKNLAATQTCL